MLGTREEAHMAGAEGQSVTGRKTKVWQGLGLPSCFRLGRQPLKQGNSKSMPRRASGCFTYVNSFFSHQGEYVKLLV